jgi:hypothetical protein
VKSIRGGVLRQVYNPASILSAARSASACATFRFALKPEILAENPSTTFALAPIVSPLQAIALMYVSVYMAFMTLDCSPQLLVLSSVDPGQRKKFKSSKQSAKGLA